MATYRMKMSDARWRLLSGHHASDEVTITAAKIDGDFLILELAGSAIPVCEEVVDALITRQREVVMTGQESIFVPKPSSDSGANNVAAPDNGAGEV